MKAGLKKKLRKSLSKKFGNLKCAFSAIYDKNRLITRSLNLCVTKNLVNQEMKKEKKSFKNEIALVVSSCHAVF
jgi:hypothetical protein